MKFDTLLEKYYRLIEADELDPSTQVDPNQQPPQPDPSMDPNAQQPQQDSQQPDQNKASPSFTYLVNVIVEALKTKRPNDISAMKYSDNTAMTVDQAFKYINMVIKNLPPQTQNKLNQSFNEAGNFDDLDEGNIVEMANLAIKALFYTEKEGTESHNLINEPVTPDNAKIIFDKISRLFSTE